MTKSLSPQSPQDDRLADFTDRVLDQKTAALASASDPDLRGLEQTVLRLKTAFPHDALEEQTIRRMQANFKARLRREQRAARPNGWATRQRLGLVLIGLAVLVAAVWIIPFFASGGGLTASAGVHGENTGLFLGLIAVMLAALWLLRRK